MGGSVFLVAEGVDGALIEEGICDRPQDMNLAMIYGTGFPPYRGGNPSIRRPVGS